LSTSGNSQNVVNAAELAKALGVKTIALTGQNKSKLSEVCTITINVPETDTYKIQELHLPVYHYICAIVEWSIFNEG
jgi:D-sedoheptulose 7-phosphate isomerase